MLKRNVKLIAALALVASIGVVGTGFTVHADALSNNKTKAVHQFNKGNNKNSLKTELDKLVTAGTITSAQETAITSAIKTAGESGTKTNFKTVLDNLVTAGTITSAQETAITSAMPQ
ncbi:hypothetical protein ACJDU8_21115, partial [Clostridium sp. WILCCON 0269]